MRKYYMSFVDFSEIANVTADIEQLVRARDRMGELGLLTEKGNPSPTQIGNLVTSLTPAFFDKLQRRLARRRGGIRGAFETLLKLCEKKEYNGMYLYLTILYGFLEWQVPEGLILLPASPEAQKIYMTEFTAAFEHYLQADHQESEGNPSDDPANR